MTFEHFFSRYQLLLPQDDIGYQNDARKSAVLLPLCEVQGELHILLCKRPNYLKHHPGQICFPGGKKDESDRCLLDTALRECHEELGIDASRISLLGEMSDYWTLTGFQIKPFIAKIDSPYSLSLSEDEVATTFLLPFSQLQQESNWQSIHFKRQFNHYTLKGFKTDHGVLWGATAQLILNLIKHVN